MTYGQLTLDGTVLTVLPTSGETFAIAEAGHAWCDECDVSALLVTDGGGEWGTACCSFLCEGCGDVESRDNEQQCGSCSHCCSHQFCHGCEVCADDLCSNCEYCESCCECFHAACGHAATYWCDYCEQCQNCCPGCSSECCDCGCGGCGDSDCGMCGHSGYASLPGWEQRGDAPSLPADWASRLEPLSDVIEPARPVEMMADFYLSEWCAVVGRSDRIRRDARTLQSAIVAACDTAFREYVFAAIGGELRHHRNVALSGGRSTAWDVWRAMAQHGDRVRLIRDAVALFEDGSWSSGYGGPAWAACARVLLSRETGALDPRTFVDRVFSLQHNGGSLLNKVDWNGEGSVYSCQAIGNAHDSRVTAVAVLYQHASADGRAILRATDWVRGCENDYQRSDIEYAIKDCDAYGRRVSSDWVSDTWVHPHNSSGHDAYGAAVAQQQRASDAAAYCADMIRSGAAWWQQWNDETDWSYNARIASMWSARV